MAKVIECAKVIQPDCSVVLRADTEPELIQRAQEHAVTHGMAANPQLAIKVKARIRDE